jgi:hypothetical protein
MRLDFAREQDKATTSTDFAREQDKARTSTDFAREQDKATTSTTPCCTLSGKESHHIKCDIRHSKCNTRHRKCGIQAQRVREKTKEHCEQVKQLSRATWRRKGGRFDRSPPFEKKPAITR